ncbi:hypothetical protein GOD67_27390 [Sinorhizobium medicae]|nr:hypothetical protein [Sinorhizobium medicae]MDX0846071.1 hypothetical protein [Sinorhizobium medicae]
MKVIATILTAISIAGLVSGTATAACKDGTSTDTTASINADKPGIAKDGTTAPLETENNASKDGETMPLANQQGGGDKNLATSQQDAEAQQTGEQAAAAKADDCVVE